MAATTTCPKCGKELIGSSANWKVLCPNCTSASDIVNEMFPKQEKKLKKKAAAEKSVAAIPAAAVLVAQTAAKVDKADQPEKPVKSVRQKQVSSKPFSTKPVPKVDRRGEPTQPKEKKKAAAAAEAQPPITPTAKGVQAQAATATAEPKTKSAPAKKPRPKKAKRTATVEPDQPEIKLPSDAELKVLARRELVRQIRVSGANLRQIAQIVTSRGYPASHETVREDLQALCDQDRPLMKNIELLQWEMYEALNVQRMAIQKQVASGDIQAGWLNASLIEQIRKQFGLDAAKKHEVKINPKEGLEKLLGQKLPDKLSD